MNMLATLVLLGFSSEAIAGSPYYQPISFTKTFSDWKLADKMGSVKKIQLEGIVDIPLYASTSGKPELLTYVGTSADDDGDLFYLDPTSSLIIVTEGFAKENELEIKVTNKRLIPVPDDFKTGGEIKYVQIPELHVGAMILKNVTAFVSGSETKNLDSLGNLNYKQAGIGLGALDISYAVLESEGVLRVAPTEQGPELMKQAGGTVVKYHEMGWTIGRVGARSLEGKNKIISPALSLIVPASFENPKEISTLLNFRSPSSGLDSYYPVEGALPIYYNDLRYDWLAPTVSGTKFENAYISRPVMNDIVEEFVPMAVLGSNVLSNYDIVVDKSTSTLAFAPTDNRKRLSSLDEELQRAKDALAEKPETTDEKTEETKEPGLNVGGTKKLIGLLEKSNQLEATVEYYDALIADEEEKTDCALWLDYGHVQRKLGNVEASLSAYQESARLYHSWWDIELHTRMDINNAQGKMKEKEIDAAKENAKGQPINTIEDGWYISQPDSCYVADGYTAYSQMLLERYDQVQALYRSNLDLDGNLARALGNTAFLMDDTQLAHEAYRQAIRLEDNRTDRRTNRLGLALIYADQGKWLQANDLFQEAMLLEGPTSSITEQIWMDNARHFIGSEDALNLLKKWIMEHPLDGGAYIALLREYTLQINDVQAALNELQANSTDTANDNNANDVEINAENEERVNELTGQVKALQSAKDEAVKGVEFFFANLDPWIKGNDVAFLSLQVQYLAYSGDLEAAEKMLGDTGELYHPDLEIAAAVLYSLQGKTEDAQAALQNAARYNPSHPGYALLLK